MRFSRSLRHFQRMKILWKDEKLPAASIQYITKCMIEFCVAEFEFFHSIDWQRLLLKEEEREGSKDQTHWSECFVGWGPKPVWQEWYMINVNVLYSDDMVTGRCNDDNFYETPPGHSCQHCE